MNRKRFYLLSGLLIIAAVLALTADRLPKLLDARQTRVEKKGFSETAKRAENPSDVPTSATTQESQAATPTLAEIPEADELKGVQLFNKRQYTAAMEPLRRAAMMGRGKAQYYLGKIYYHGLDVQKDDSEAAKWYAKAVRRGYRPAFSALALMYHMGFGVRKDPLEDVRLLGIAAENGDAGAQWELGKCYQNGQEVPKNDQEVLKWYRRAAEQGESTAQFLLGNYYIGICYQREPRTGLRREFWVSPETLELRVEGFKWKVLAGKQDNPVATEEVARVVKSLTTTNELGTLPGEKEVVAEAFRRADAFVPRKENTNEWVATASLIANEPISSGTGFFISDDGYLLTNFHVVDDAMRIDVQYGRSKFPAALVKVDPTNDLAVLKVVGKFRALPMGPSRMAKLGDSVFTVGFPNPNLQGVAPKLTDGKISSLSGMQDDARYFQISVAVQPGNSGGALVSSVGNVIGIVTASLSDIITLRATGALPQNVNYAIKSSYVLSLLESEHELAGKLKEPQPSKERKFEDVVKEAQEAAALVLVY